MLQEKQISLNLKFEDQLNQKDQLHKDAVKSMKMKQQQLFNKLAMVSKH